MLACIDDYVIQLVIIEYNLFTLFEFLAKSIDFIC
jgi:hypothetical protein